MILDGCQHVKKNRITRVLRSAPRHNDWCSCANIRQMSSNSTYTKCICSYCRQGRYVTWQALFRDRQTFPRCDALKAPKALVSIRLGNGLLNVIAHNQGFKFGSVSVSLSANESVYKLLSKFNCIMSVQWEWVNEWIMNEWPIHWLIDWLIE